MNKIFAKVAAVVVIGSMGLAGTSCSDDLDLQNPNEFGYGSYWKDQQQFTMYQYALANQFRGNYTAQLLFGAGELRAGALTTNLINGSGPLDVEIINNNLNESRAQYSAFAGWYDYIANLNELIYQCEGENGDVLEANVKEGLLGVAYGMRAYSYFRMYMMYGGVPLRLEPDVLLGEYDPTKLYKARSTAEETLNQIKSDLNTSLTHWNASNGWSFGGAHKDYYWSKAATEMLAGEVYLWSAKVATDDHTTANADADVATAKGYFSNVINNYGYSLYPKFREMFSTPHNSEFIFATCGTSISDNVALNAYQAMLIWSKASGASTTAWSYQDASGFNWREDEGVSLFNEYYDPATKTTSQYTCWATFGPSPNRYLYKNALFFQYDYEDARQKCFLPLYAPTDEQMEAMQGEDFVSYIEDFDPHDYKMLGSWYMKYVPSVAEGQQSYAFWNDGPIYRLGLAYAYMAEIANYEGDNAGVETWINGLRKRAYGDNWDETLYGYHAGTFAENESAIMREKDKEFVNEGQRWFDLRRLTTVKGGTQLDHFLFQPQGCVGYGLDPAANPWMVENTGTPIATTTPVLTAQEEYKALWPLNKALLDSDPLLDKHQNPGY